MDRERLYTTHVCRYDFENWYEEKRKPNRVT